MGVGRHASPGLESQALAETSGYGDHLHYTNWIVRGQSAENPETNHGNCP